MDECDVPLQQLARLKEKLIKHARAEDAAIKRIRDLEMQMVGMKHDVEVSVSNRFGSAGMNKSNTLADSDLKPR